MPIKIFVDKNWLEANKDFADTTITSKNKQFIDHSIKILHQARQEFVESLKKQGLIVTSDPKEYDENTICIIDSPQLVSHDNSFQPIYQVIERKIHSSGGPDFNYPTTVDLPSFWQRPFYPAVFKNIGVNRGIDKFLVETPEQFAKIFAYFQKSLAENIKLNWRDVVFQQYIETPTNYKTYMRVLISGAGKVLGSSLKCSKNMPNSISLDGDFERVFLRPDSPFFIRAKKMFNYYSGGDNISLEKPEFLNDEQKRTLAAHGIDPNNMQVPNEVMNVCRNIMANCNKELGVIAGIDFILNERDGHWYFLEFHSQPAIDEWADVRGIPLPPDDGEIENYIAREMYELVLRKEALTQIIEQRLKKDQKQDF